ncbi:TPA: hypothetical protein DDW35_12240 [Candidatus Sumerlaeota bacterium]|jgi:RNA polymerase sigma-70 factor, ECF subfamily|nr:hypothetical protein [Candidatus Sumerlaeota bacterium]
MNAVMDFPSDSWFWRLVQGAMLRAEETLAPPQVDAYAEERALAREVARNPDSFQVLYQRYYERILNFFYRRVRERDVAEDLTSQVFLSALEYLAATERDLPFRPWLYRVATNAWISYERKKLRWGERIMAEVGRWLGTQPVPTPSQALHERERIVLVRRALMNLPPLYREPILLRCDEELSDAEIGEALDLTPGSVRSRISRGMALLRSQIQPLLEEKPEERTHG